jgi:hypothetical protein
VDEVKAHPARHVVVTGGEPMIQPEIVPLTERLRALGMHITIETAGTVFRAGGLRPDEHQPEAFQLDARRRFGEHGTSACAFSLWYSQN